MNSIVARLLLSSIVFLLPLIVAGQTDESDESLTLTAKNRQTGEDFPPEDGKAPIEGTPGDGVPDAFNYSVDIEYIEDLVVQVRKSAGVLPS